MSTRVFYLISGMSGAGKSTVLNSLEDSGFYCVDNLPVDLFDKFLELFFSASKNIKKVALAIDIRSGRQFSEIVNSVREVKKQNVQFRILFLECEEQALVRRFKETRRRHPLYKGNLHDAIRRERRMLSPLLDHADIVIDTSELRTRDLGLRILELLHRDETGDPFQVSIVSFGYKHGVPKDADLVFDVRFMENPFYREDLRHKRGYDSDVAEFVFQDEKASEFINRVREFLNFLLPLYIQEGRRQMTICFGCTGGQHRSVASVERLYDMLDSSGDIFFQRFHRDCKK